MQTMTVGSVSNFVDVVLNLGSSQVHQDNILSQAVKMKKNIVFYGDDTWIKLFPKVFSRYEGTTSFFVSDFIEVDNNVTRNVLLEMKQEDWDMMILHYLGLDHIGHLEGPFSSKISWKLNEMDNIIEIIHRQLKIWKRDQKKEYLLIICGDHGMKDTGGHGGSTLGEILVPFLVFGSSCNTTAEIFQVDIAVTLSTLMGLPIPVESVGKLIYGLIDNLPLSIQLDAYYNNVMQLIQNYHSIIEDNSELGVKETELYLQATKSQRENDMKYAIRLYREVLSQLSAKLIDSLTRFDTLCLYLAMIILLQASYLPCISESKNVSDVRYIIFITLALTFALRQICVLNNNNSALCSNNPFTVVFIGFISYLIVFNTIFLFVSAKALMEYLKTVFRILCSDKILLFVVTCSVMQIVSTISTSFIEEEHMTWYYFWTTWMVVALMNAKIKKDSISLFVSLIMSRIIRKLNQTGDHWASLPDISDWLIESHHKIYLSLVFGFGLVAAFFCMNHFDSKKRRKLNRLGHFLSILNKCFTISCLILIYAYRLAVRDVIFFNKFSNFLSDKGIAEFEIFLYVFLVTALVKFICIYFNGVYSTNDTAPVTIDVLKAFADLWILITCLLLRPTNVILPSSLIFSSNVVCKVLRKQPNELTKLILIHHWLARVYFFYQGNSNSLASIDIASGYIGQREYNSWVVGSLIICSSFSMPILAYLLMIRHYVGYIFRHFRRQNWNIIRSSILISINIWFTLEAFAMFFYMVIIMNFRYHLFIWSVFSPKLLYFSAYYVLLYPVFLIVQLLFDKFSVSTKL
ncbi:GPI ethanolamine phosphate transferase 2 isoform X2 [Planococcus citri]|uniref:GPI ethanolamine phosphate transferase 2 isoform X2 n=1 Tax=Planococcus citri TaxID=170843 RepID=UPI0031F7D693